MRADRLRVSVKNVAVANPAADDGVTIAQYV